jgi:hypothetical protein
MSLAIKSVMENCIEWKQCCTHGGYGRKWLPDKRKHFYAHRLAYCKDRCLTLEAIEGLHVMHTCDNRKCVNPNHLRLGTHADNMADMGAKGRSPRGEKHWLSKLTAADVLAIREAYARGDRHPRRLAKQYGVNYYTIMSAAKGKLWGWL